MSCIGRGLLDGLVCLCVRNYPAFAMRQRDGDEVVALVQRKDAVTECLHAPGKPRPYGVLMKSDAAPGFLEVSRCPYDVSVDAAQPPPG
jgi:hypothetical protein